MTNYWPPMLLPSPWIKFQEFQEPKFLMLFHQWLIFPVIKPLLKLQDTLEDSLQAKSQLPEDYPLQRF